MSKRTDCQQCGVARPTAKESGMCSYCWEIYLAKARLNGAELNRDWNLERSGR